MRVRPAGVGVGSPLEDAAGDVQRARDDTVVSTLVDGAQVDDERAVSHSFEGFTGFRPWRDPLSGHREQLIDCLSRHPTPPFLG